MTYIDDAGNDTYQPRTRRGRARKRREQSGIPDLISTELQHRQERRAQREERRKRLGYAQPDTPTQQ